jgi:hypothetical protein
MCRPLYEAVENGKVSSDEAERQRWARLEAAMAHFVEGGLVTEQLVKQLDPPKFEHWELRSRKPRPSLRVFGRFALPNVFIATHVVLRKELGGKWSFPFEYHKLVCEQHWQEAGLDEPFSDAPYFRYEEYMTENAVRSVEI